MKSKIITATILLILILTLTSCNSTDDSKTFSVKADLVYYDSLSEMNSNSDCFVVAEVLEKNDCFSVEYSPEDFEKYDEYLEEDSKISSFMLLSIRTPYKIKVKEIISSNIDLKVNDELSLYQIGGTYCGYTLDFSESEVLSVGSEYVFALIQYDDVEGLPVHYGLTSPVQASAKIAKNSIFSSKKNTLKLITNEQNDLFDNINSTDDIYKAIGKTK